MKKQETVKVGKDTLTPQPMAKWYSPAMLKTTAMQVGLSTIFGEFADKRETFSHSIFPQPIDYSNGGKVEELWVDYLADTGDGFNSTYSMAYLLQKGLQHPLGKDNKPISDTLERGKVLIFGGDEIYPAASQDDYLQKLWLPFECAFPYDWQTHKNVDRDKLPDVYAIPGNHDWYDGLNFFVKLFCQNRAMGGWQTQQKRSYFAMQLPHNWWIWGIDIQLGGDIDSLQLEYFQKLAFGNRMKDGDKIILCTAEPAWVHIDTIEGKKRFDKLDFFVNNYVKKCTDLNGNVRKFDLKVTISGDLHHYARYQHDFAKDGKQMSTQRITAGGGGAFMHPTHNLPEELSIIPDIENPTVDRKLQLKATFPESDKSKKMAFKNILFAFKNFQFSIIFSAALLVILLLIQYSSLIWSVNYKVLNSAFGLISFSDYPLLCLLYKLVITPAPLILTLLFSVGIYSFRDNVHGIEIYKKCLAAAHAIAHIVAGFALMILIINVCRQFISDGANHWYFYAVISTVYLFFGGLVHGTIFGIYLLVANLVLCCHDNEAFSHFAIEDFKNMVKFHITKDGTLKIYPIGVKKICRDWNYHANPSNQFDKPLIEPKNGNRIEYHLIEQPIVIR